MSMRWIDSAVRGANHERLPSRVRILALRALLPIAHKRLTLPALLTALSPHSCAQKPTMNVFEGTQHIQSVLHETEQLLRRNRLTRTTCLYRALIRYGLLASSGTRDLRFAMGIHNESGNMIGHAWIEHEGKPLGEELSKPYERTFLFPSNESSHAQHG